MALPLTVEAIGRVPGHNPPHKSSGGNYYFVTGNASNAIDVEKTANPSTTASAIQDGSNAPTESPSSCLASVSDGTYIHIVCIDATNLLLQYSRFNMSTDTWSVTDITIANLTGMTAPSTPWCSITYNSGRTTELVVAASGLSDSIMGGTYERADFWYADVAVTTAGGWTGPTSVDGVGDQNHYYKPTLVSGSSGNVHLLWQGMYLATSAYRTASLNSSNSLSTPIGGNYSFSEIFGAGHDDAGTFRVAASRAQFGNNAGLVYGAESSGVLGALTGASHPTMDIDGGSTTITLVSDGTDFYALYSDDTTNDVFYSVSTDNGANWSSPVVEALDAVTSTIISAAFLDSGKIAYLYDDGGSTKYNELTLSGGGSYTLNVTPGTITYTDSAVSLTRQRKLPVTPGTITYTAAAVSLSKSKTVNVDPGTITYTGAGASFIYDRAVDVTPGTITYASATVDLIRDRLLTADPGTVTYTAASVDLLFSYTLNVSPGSIDYTASPVTFDYERAINVAPGTVTYAAAAVNLAVDRQLAVSPGTVTYTAADVVLAKSKILSADPGTVTYTAAAVQLQLERLLNVAPGTVTYTAADVYVSKSKVLSVDAGTVTYSGSAVQLKLDKVLDVSPGTLTYTGSPATLRWDRAALDVSPGTVTFTGAEVNLTVDKLLNVAPGVFTYTASGVQLARDLVVETTAGTVTFTAADVQLVLQTTSPVLNVDPGTITYTAASVALIYSGSATPQRRKAKKRKTEEELVDRTENDLAELTILLVLSGVLDE